MKRAAIIIGKIFLVIISVILSIALFATTLVTMLVADVRVATNKDNLANLLKQTLSAPTQQMELAPITAAGGEGFQFDLSGNLSDQLVEYAYYQVIAPQAGEGESVVSLDAVKSFVADSTIKDFVADKAASIVSDIYTGEKTVTITGAEIEQLITENAPAIKEHFDVEIPAEAITEIAQGVEQIPVIQQIQEEGVASIILGTGNSTAPDNDASNSIVTPSTQSNPVAAALEAVRAFTSTTALLICIGACAVLIGLLFLCAWNKPYKAMIYAGVPVFLAGLLFAVPTLIAWLAVGTWTKLFSFQPVIGMVSRFILMLTGSVCGTVTFLGIALFVGGIVLGVHMRKRAKAKAAPEALPAEEAPAEEVPTEEVPAAEESV